MSIKKTGLCILILMMIFSLTQNNIGDLWKQQMVEAHNGNTYSAPFSNSAPLLDASFNDPEWEMATNVTHDIYNPNGYRMSGLVAKLSVALLGTPSGLYMALTLTMVQLDSSGMGFESPGFLVQFDTDHNGIINSTDFENTPDDDIMIFATDNQTKAGSTGSSWSSREFEYSMIGDLVGKNLTKSLRAEIRYSYLKSNTTTQTVGVNFGIRYHKFGGASWDVYSFMVDSGDQAYNTIRYASHYTIGSFANLVLNPGVVIDMYPPTINFLTPVTGIDGVYNLSVIVTDVNDIVSVEFSEDGVSWIVVDNVLNDPQKYTHSWNSSGFVGESLFFRATDNQSNLATLTILVSQSQPGGDYEFVAVVVDNSPPLLNLVSPQSNSILSGTITVQIEAIDATGVVMVDWKIGDGEWNNMYYNPNNGYWEATWDTTLMSDGTYSLSFKSRDSVNNTVTLENYVSLMINSSATDKATTITETNIVTETNEIVNETTVTVTDVVVSTVENNYTVTVNGTEDGNSTNTFETPVPMYGVILAMVFTTLYLNVQRKQEKS